MTTMEQFRREPDKRFPAALVAAFLLQTAGALFWAGSAAERITSLERTLASDQAAIAQVAVLEEQVRAHHGKPGPYRSETGSNDAALTRGPPGPSLALRAFVAFAGPLDRLTTAGGSSPSRGGSRIIMTFQIAYARRPLARRNTHAGLTALGPDEFEGYASLFGVADGVGDTVAAGAFAASLRRRGPSEVRMLYQHFAHTPIGVWEEIAEDARGLYVRGRLVDEVERARDVRALLREGALNGLSIGFRTVRAKRGAANTRTLLEIELWEISVVTFPLLAGSKVTATGNARSQELARMSFQAGKIGYAGPRVTDVTQSKPQGRRHGTGNQSRGAQPRSQAGLRGIPARLRGVQAKQ